MNWPHAPAHWLFEPGIYMVTAGTYRNLPHLSTPDRRTFFLETLFRTAEEFGWGLQAWAVMSNHYHLIIRSPGDPSNLRKWMGKLHMLTARRLNELDASPGRKVWFQFWDSRIDYERSYMARLNYVNLNPIKHGIVDNAESYAWCSASWFAQNASPAFAKTVAEFKTDRVEVPDEF
jgi:putative transposase